MLKLEEKICGQCGVCVAVCQFEALNLKSGQLEITFETCTQCGDCVLVCPVSALKIQNEYKL